MKTLKLSILALVMISMMTVSFAIARPDMGNGDRPATEGTSLNEENMNDENLFVFSLKTLSLDIDYNCLLVSTTLFALI